MVIPLYPQFSISTSGSSLRLLEAMFERDPALSGLKHSVIASWWDVLAVLLLQAVLCTLPGTAKMQAVLRSAHTHLQLGLSRFLAA